MKENEKRVSVLVEETDQSKTSHLSDNEKSSIERLRKPLVFMLMGVVFLGCMYLIFKPSSEKIEIENSGLNDAVPQPSDEGMQADKQKAYEQEILEQKDQQKRNALTTLSDYWNEESSPNPAQDPLDEQEDQNENYNNETKRSANPALNSYRNTQSALASFYKDETNETRELRKQLDELKEKLADKEVPKGVSVDDQVSLMEKSYQMAAKYLPSGTNTGGSGTVNQKAPVLPSSQKESFTAFTTDKKNIVSALYRKDPDSTFLTDWSGERNRKFGTAGSAIQAVQPKNSVKACIQETQTIAGESGVQLRLLEPAQTSNGTIPLGTLLTATAKFHGGRLQMKVTSIALDGTIIPADITIYDLDGQQGLYVPYSPEMNALTEMAANMSQQTGTSLMLTQSAGQQVAADLSRSVVQGISGYFSKRVKTPKVTLKAGYQVFLVSKK